MGISEGDRRRVFDPFFTTRQEKGGTGLGLSVAEGIVKDLGGEIRVEQRGQGGTLVTITLPFEGGESPAI
ncbi:MAG: ATP-binding protein [Myxococcota bacterium]|nr:ATP-binding protein [Myxococcota bacterium]